MESICMKCQILFMEKIRKIFQNVVSWKFYPACEAFNMSRNMRKRAFKHVSATKTQTNLSSLIRVFFVQLK